MKVLDRKSKTEFIRDEICRYILKHSLDEGALLPSENTLCEQFKVSRVTVRRAIASLAKDNVVFSLHGKGLFVKSLENARKTYGADLLTGNIGLFLNRNEFTLPAIFGIEDVVKPAGFHLTYCSLGGNHEQNVSNMLSVMRNGMDGCAIIPIEATPYPEVYLDAFQKMKNIVILDADSPEDAIPSVRTDDIAGIRQVMRYLISLGHRRIAFMGGELLTSSNTDRYNAYRLALAECPDAEKEIILSIREYIPNHAEQVLTEYLKRTKKEDLPTAVVCTNDKLAGKVIGVLQSAGFRIPEDISVTGYANMKQAYVTVPAITTVEQQPYEQGRMVGELLLKLIYRQEIPNRHIRVKPNLQINQSCTVPRNWKINRRK